MRFSEILYESAIPTISPQAAIDAGMFGPVYHGSQNIDSILKTGFDPNKSRPTNINHFNKPEGTANGYPLQNYYNGYPAPIHHLGFGIYFTTNKSIAKMFNGGTTRGLKEFYINTKNIDTINFGSNNTMMRWWMQNGYDPAPDTVSTKNFTEWVRATDHLTETLKSKYDAVWFKGKGMRKLLDGDQVVVFDPSLIRIVDQKLSSGLEIGAKVVHNQQIVHWVGRNDVYVDEIKYDPRFAGWKGIFRVTEDGNAGSKIPLIYIPPPTLKGKIVRKSPINPNYAHMHGNARYFIEVKWDKGGTHSNYYDTELTPV